MIQPLLALACSRRGKDLCLHLQQRPLDQDFIIRSQISAPIDVQLRIVQPGKDRLGVEHHHHVFNWRHISQTPTRQYLQGLANAVQGDAMTRGQRLDTADAGNDLKGKVPRFDQIENAQCTVIQPRVAP